MLCFKIFLSYNFLVFIFNYTNVDKNREFYTDKIKNLFFL